MKVTWFIIKWMLIVFGATTLYYGLVLQVKYDGFTAKLIQQINSPTLHKEALPTYMRIANTLLDTGDIAMASIRRVKVDPAVTNEDVEQSMSSIATEMGIREVGILPLSAQVELQLSEKQRFLKIYQYCSPAIAMQMVDYSDAYSAYLPCRIALIEDAKGDRWLYTLDMDLMIYGGKPLPPELHQLALGVQQTIYTIQDRAAQGDF